MSIIRSKEVLKMSGFVNKGLKFLIDREYRFLILCNLGLYKNVPDDEYVKRVYKAMLGGELNLQNPKGFCEKLNWLKLYYRKPEYTDMVDKYKVKEYVSEKIGSEHVVPVYGVWDCFEDINFDELPDQFVLKCTHDSGGFAICKDKKTFDKKKAKRVLEKHLKKNYYWIRREWPYKNVKPRILAEKYMDSLGKTESVEYKITCMWGEAKVVTVCTGIAHDTFDKRHNDNFDKELRRLPWYAYYTNTDREVNFPNQIRDIINYAEKLSTGIPQVRVDFYIHNDEVFFGEMTFYTWGGFIHFTPPEWDQIMGEWLRLPESKYNNL